MKLRKNSEDTLCHTHLHFVRYVFTDVLNVTHGKLLTNMITERWQETTTVADALSSSLALGDDGWSVHLHRVMAGDAQPGNVDNDSSSSGSFAGAIFTAARLHQYCTRYLFTVYAHGVQRIKFKYIHEACRRCSEFIPIVYFIILHVHRVLQSAVLKEFVVTASP